MTREGHTAKWLILGLVAWTSLFGSVVGISEWVAQIFGHPLRHSQPLWFTVLCVAIYAVLRVFDRARKGGKHDSDIPGDGG